MSMTDPVLTISGPALVATDYAELQPFVQSKLIEPIDIAAAKLLVELAGRQSMAQVGTYAWVGMCLGLKAVRCGHTCVDFTTIGDWLWDEESPGNTARQWLDDSTAWLDQLRQIPELIGNPGELKPFILDGTRLYVARTWDEETSIAREVRERLRCRTLRITLGGPGTGKTTKIVRELTTRLQYSLDQGRQLPRFALAAPTAKAAARMSEAIRKALSDSNCSPEVTETLTREPAQTVHKLLGYNPRKDCRYRWNQTAPLPYDLVIVDETSMVSSSLMYRLLSALAPTTQLHLVGDPNQLASVDAGSVLGDLARALSTWPEVGSYREELQQVYRTESQAIIELAAAIKRAEVPSVLTVLANPPSPSIRWVEPTDTHAMEIVLEESVSHARRLQHKAQNHPSEALNEQRKFQVLCAHREGQWGVSGWNAMTEQRLGLSSQEVWYLGRPLMATRNNRSLGLTNGDTGVIANRDGSRAAFFGLPSAPVRIPIARLEAIVTVHAQTIHKSQGSEYDHVVVVLPTRPSRIVTRELLYTAVTRAKNTVTLIGSSAVIAAAIATPNRRVTGLEHRLSREQDEAE